jgi:hypothetical protein
VGAFGTVGDGADTVFLDDGVVKGFAGGVLGVPCIFGIISDIISQYTSGMRSKQGSGTKLRHAGRAIWAEKAQSAIVWASVVLVGRDNSLDKADVSKSV